MGRHFLLPLAAAISLALTAGCAGIPEKPRAAVIGAVDGVAAAAIVRANSLIALRNEGRFADLAVVLVRDMDRYKDSPYILARIANELADIFTYQLLDIESALDIDRQMAASLQHSGTPDDRFVPRLDVASQVILADKSYKEQYLSVSNASLMEASSERLRLNQMLVDGRRKSSSTVMSAAQMRQYADTVLADLANVPARSPERKMLISRLVRAEYENQRAGGPSLSIKQTARSQDVSPSLIDLNEIDFLSLADFYIQRYRSSGDIQYAEYALDVVYRPYTNLRSKEHRWRFNKIINDYISILVDGTYERRQFDETVYYAALNKSRMLLEEGLAFQEQGVAALSVAALTAKDGIPRTVSGLPQKSWFKLQLASAGAFVDFYVGGKYVAQSALAGSKMRAADRSTMPYSTRDFGVEGAEIQDDTFVDDALYVSRVLDGKVVDVKKVTGRQLTELKHELNTSYQLVSRGQPTKPVAYLQTLGHDGLLPATIKVSPDKWMNKHPLDLHLGLRVTRAINLFTAGSNDLVGDLRVTGFFNPTLDLAGAEQEADAIRSNLPGATVFRREAAKIAALDGAAAANVVHLSMHGAFNGDDPKNSKLYFAGARRGLTTDDPNALYAKNMSKYPALRERDLIFAAACQTGLSAADQSNEAELMGILRPLVANRNKNIILSLWKVDDIATRDFVAAFYARLALTKNVVTSFHFAQDEIRTKYKQPYYWAAFYLAQAR